MKRETPKVGQVVYRAGSLVAPEGDSREVTFIASDESVDRMGDIIRVSGWDLKHFKNNPVLLFGHKSSELPLGRVNEIWIDGTKLMAKAEFATEDMNPKAEQVLRMVKAGFLNATSVGFRPTKMPNDIKDPTTNSWCGYEFVGQDLYELSVVPVPANPAALAVSRSMMDADAFYRELLPKHESASAAMHAARLREIQIIGMRRHD